MDGQSPINLSTGKFIKLINCLNGKGVPNLSNAVEYVKSVCPLVQNDISLIPFAINCLRLASQDKRKKYCKNESCPLLGSEQLEVIVASGYRGGYVSHLVDPTNGDITYPKTIKRFPTRPSEYTEKLPINYIPTKNEECSVGDITPQYTKSLFRILKYEYDPIFKINHIKIPNIIDEKFLKENTDFRLLKLEELEHTVPVDELTLSLTGWKYNDRKCSLDSLADMTFSTINEVFFREPFYNDLANVISNSPNPIQRFMDIKDDFKNIQ